MEHQSPRPEAPKETASPAASGNLLRRLLARIDRRDALLVALFAALTVALLYWPTGFENRLPTDAVQVKARILDVDNAHVHQYGIVREGEQRVTAVPLSGPFAGQHITADNILLGKLELDKIFAPGETALLVLSLRDGKIVSAVAKDHWRLGLQGLLLGIFALFLALYAGWTGIKAVLSFLFAALLLWKILVPLFLKGYDPMLVTLCVLAVLMAAIIFLVGGVGRRSLAAYLGALAGVAVTCLLALATAPGFALPGAVKPYAETLLYTGYAHLNLGRMFLATICLGASGAIMDVAMDVAASQAEVVAHNPGIGPGRLCLSGFRVGRVVVGTMATTLLLAYCGGSLALLMVFMAQGVPLVNVATMPHVAAEIANTLVGSFGLVTAAPLTAIAGALLLRR
ncbi:YibE/F family protein [Solidesulfovibrio sp. C21]|uniref:YibE/F family protein n=1 Tax=Solidesulfovibrio sp. C21 TaxID=3398613 RepID=UPI0039FD3470